MLKVCIVQPLDIHRFSTVVYKDATSSTEISKSAQLDTNEQHDSEDTMYLHYSNV
jgi:hypothetical protein